MENQVLNVLMSFVIARVGSFVEIHENGVQ